MTMSMCTRQTRPEVRVACARHEKLQCNVILSMVKCIQINIILYTQINVNKYIFYNIFKLS